MIKLDAHKPVHFCDGLTRRDFLHAGALGMAGLGLSLTDLFALKAAGAARIDAQSAGNTTPVVPPERVGAAARNERLEIVFVSPGG